MTPETVGGWFYTMWPPARDWSRLTPCNQFISVDEAADLVTRGTDNYEALVGLMKAYRNRRTSTEWYSANIYLKALDTVGLVEIRFCEPNIPVTKAIREDRWMFTLYDRPETIERIIELAS